VHELCEAGVTGSRDPPANAQRHHGQHRVAYLFMPPAVHELGGGNTRYQAPVADANQRIPNPDC
jgi:hypothetical protein